MEYLGLYDKNGTYTGEKIERSKKMEVREGRYFRVVLIFIENEKGEFLIQKVSDERGGVYATTGGHVQDGVSSMDTAKIEVLEELGIDLRDGEAMLFHTEQGPCAYLDSYYVKKNVVLSSLHLQQEEVASVSWMTVDEINQLINENKFRKGNINAFRTLLEMRNYNVK